MPSTRSATIAVCALLVLCVSYATATERHVPAEYATIQAAIDACVAGDEVIIADGTYTGVGNKDLDFKGLAITVRSASDDPATCVIDCEGSGQGFYFHSGESAAAIVRSLTIRNGRAGSGGGVVCDSSSPTLTNCTMTGNTADDGGGGIYCYSSSPTLTNCMIMGNNAVNGGGVYCYRSSSPTLTNCTITHNSANNAAVVAYESPGAKLTNCILWANTPRAIGAYFSSLVVTYCDVQGGWDGAGNIDADPGFAFPDDPHLLGSSPCIDAGTNSPPGGLPPDDLEGQPRPLDSDGNGSAVADMGAYEFNSATPMLALSAMELTITAQPGQTGSQTLEIRNSSLGALPWEVESEADWLTAEPAAGESAGEVDTVTLTGDAANLAHGMYFTTVWVIADQAFNAPRAVSVVLHVPSTLQVPSQYSTIQAAIDAANVPGDEVVIADGVYSGAGNKDLDFDGRAIPVRSATGNPAACIIDCEGAGRGFDFHSGETAASKVEGLTIRNGNSGGVNCYSSAPTLTNCIITGNTGSAGGVSCSGSSPTLVNCTITGNTAQYLGGGVYCWLSNATLTNCTITDNSAAGGGGVGCTFDSSPTLTDCTITDNMATFNGGGVYWTGGSFRSKLVNCTVAGNTAGNDGGGLYCHDAHPTLTNCTITANTTSGRGGAAYCDNHSGAMLMNCVVAGNIASSKCGGVYCCEYSTPTLANCVLTGNTASYGGGGVCCDHASPTLTNCILWALPQPIYLHSGDPVVRYCDVQGGWSGTGNIDADPLFCDPDGPDDDPNTFADNSYRLGVGSPCIDAGDNAATGLDDLDVDGDDCLTELLPVDLDGNARFCDDPATMDTGYGEVPIVDIGAYEYGACPPPPTDPCPLPGDVNCDGAVDFGDINPFVLLLSNRPAWIARYPDCPIVNGDIDTDGVVGFGDINPFVAVLTAGK